MADWIMVIDDDTPTLKVAGRILSRAGMRVTAFSSGQLALEYIRKHSFPDMILLDLNMPDMDGFETLKLLKAEMAPGKEVPIAFLTADESSNRETRALEAGAIDYIRKPFDPEVLIQRVRKTLDIRHQIDRFAKNAETDPLTGLLNKAASEALMTRLCAQEKGLLCMVDLDAFKSINDIFGHDMGDRILIMFSRIIEKNLPNPNDCGRIGGDEFVAFLRNRSRSTDLAHFSEKVNAEYLAGVHAILGDRTPFSTGVSIGAVSIPEHGRDFPDLFHLADQALYIIKRNGKHGGRLYRSAEQIDDNQRREMDLETITAILEERIEAPNAMWMGRDVFGSIYKYMVRYMDRYHSSAFRVLLTLKVHPGITDADRAECIVHFRQTIRTSLRNSDVMMECGENQLFLLLPEIQSHDIERVIGRLLHKWNHSEYPERAEIVSEYGPMHSPRPEDAERSLEGHEWVVVVDDDESTLHYLEGILAQQHLKVTTLSSGSELLSLTKENLPDLILLDLLMPDPDGLETLRQLQQQHPGILLPVVFLTASSDPVSEGHCLQYGALDLIHKPIVPEVLTLRVRNMIELVHLRKSFSEAVLRKNKESGQLSLHLVQTLAEAVDSRDEYSSGHSTRVAEYSREIGRRIGYTSRQQDELYIMALLHDIGKIGIPERIINKPGDLSGDEYAEIQSHSRIGARILRKIEEIPRLVEGARWHHEWYDGSGYPDGLSGDNIPESARIIAVADAFDAMSSPRSYRDRLPREDIKKEIKKGKGTQFDPRFADIMLAMMDEEA